MGELIDEFDAQERRRMRARWLMVGAVVAVVVFWATGPFGIVLLVRGSMFGWLLLALAALSVVGAIAAFRASRRLVPANAYRIEADASQQADPSAVGPWGSKALGWVTTFLNR
ncbi:hypothetical protein ACPPVQ_13340 [Diaminobutyricibacter sp. McL0618]|uniref:hypothetical protein n=1 Tax=Leifsonia sp. McL0618 TaxID=3415677 RepID=UPI003CF8E9D9